MKKYIDHYKKMPKGALANKWFWIHDIPTSFILDEVWLDLGDFEIQITESEVEYRASEFVRLLENDLIKEPFKGILMNQML